MLSPTLKLGLETQIQTPFPSMLELGNCAAINSALPMIKSNLEQRFVLPCVALMKMFMT